jgi:hypothetical protein
MSATSESTPDDSASAALREAADTIATAVRSVLAPVFVHVKELEEEAHAHEAHVEKLHTDIDELRARLERRDPEETAALIYDFFYVRGSSSVAQHWKLQSTDVRDGLIALSTELFGFGDADY